MSIELPPIPAQPNGDSTPDQWAHYRWAVSLHVTAEQTAAMAAQTAQLVLMTAATQATANIGQQILDQGPAPTGSGFSEAFVMSLLRLVLDKPEPAGG